MKEGPSEPSAAFVSALPRSSNRARRYSAAVCARVSVTAATTFVVNTGALVERPLSGDGTPSHNRNGASRYAIPFFISPNHDVVVKPVPTWVGPDHPPRYEPTTYGAFSQCLLLLNFAHRRADSSGEYA